MATALQCVSNSVVRWRLQLAAAAFALLFSACHGSDAEAKPSVDVYVAGQESMSGHSYLATVWKNGVPTRYTDGSPLADGNHLTSFTSMCFSGDDMYTAGWVIWPNWDLLDGGFPVPVFVATSWMNGAATTLTDGTSWYAMAHSIAVSDGGDVYAVGYEYVSARNYRGPAMATIWRNGEAKRISDGTDDSVGLYSVCLHGGDVYVAGTDARPRNLAATLWVNDIPTRLSDENNEADARCVFVSDDGDVYVGGYETNDTRNPVATIWKNGVPQRLSSPILMGCVHSIFVDGKDVYAAGYEIIQGGQGREFATVWKNGVPQHLSDRDRYALATSVYVMDGDVYVAGYETYDGSYYEADEKGKEDAMLWVNGVPQTLAKSIDLDRTYNRANAVVVRRRGQGQGR